MFGSSYCTLLSSEEAELRRGLVTVTDQHLLLQVNPISSKFSMLKRSVRGLEMMGNRKILHILTFSVNRRKQF